MAEQVGDGDLLRGIRHRQPEVRHVIGEPAVPAQHAVVDQHAGDGAGEGFRQRGEAEHGVRVHRLAVARIGDAVTARTEHAAVLDDGDRKAGDAAAGHELLCDRLEAAHIECGNGLRRRRNARRDRLGGCGGGLLALPFQRALRRGCQRKRQQCRDQSDTRCLPNPADFHRPCPLRMLHWRPILARVSTIA